MKKYLFLFLIFACSYNLFAQDLIVTQQGDSVNCKITNMTTDFIYFTFNHKGEIRNTLLPSKDVKSYQTNYFQQNNIPADKIVVAKNYKHWRFAIDAGSGYRTAKAYNVPAQLQSYVENLRWGKHLGGEICYYYNENFGIGAKYVVSNSYEKYSDNYAFTDLYGNTLYGEMSDDITIRFAGPYFGFRYLSKNHRNVFLMNISIGYMDYVNNTYLPYKTKISGNTIGSAIQFGYDFNLSESFAIGCKLSYLQGVIKEITVINSYYIGEVELDSKSYEGLQRLDFSLGLRLNL